MLIPNSSLIFCWKKVKINTLTLFHEKKKKKFVELTNLVRCSGTKGVSWKVGNIDRLSVPWKAEGLWGPHWSGGLSDAAQHAPVNSTGGSLLGDAVSIALAPLVLLVVKYSSFCLSLSHIFLIEYNNCTYTSLVSYCLLFLIVYDLSIVVFSPLL